MKTILLTAAAAMLAASAATAQTTQRFTASKASEYGIVYSLPVTEIDITIEAELTERRPGEFFNYARRHLGITDAIRQTEHSARIKSITISPRGVANPDSRWLAQFKSGTSPYMILDAGGVPLAINTEQVAAVEHPALPEARAAEPTILETEAARQAMTQDMIRSSSTSKRAELAAQRIFELRDTRSELLSGQADNPPADGRAMQLVLDNLARQEAALTAMFAGTESVSTVVSTIALCPDSLGLADEIIARLSPVDGILSPDNLAGAPVTVSVDVLEQGELPVNEKGEVKRFPKGGVAYNIPGRAVVAVRYEGQEVGRAEVSLAQLGVTFGLDPALFVDKKAPACLRLNPDTGAITFFGPADTAVE